MNTLLGYKNHLKTSLTMIACYFNKLMHASLIIEHLFFHTLMNSAPSFLYKSVYIQVISLRYPEVQLLYIKIVCLLINESLGQDAEATHEFECGTWSCILTRNIH